MLHSAQAQMKKYYKAYLVEGKHPASGPSKSLLAMTDPSGPERTLLKESFNNARKSGSHILSADVRVTVGPETASDGSRHTQIKFHACVDSRKVVIAKGSRSRSGSWELLEVDMRARAGASIKSRTSDPGAWLVNRLNQISEESSCAF